MNIDKKQCEHCGKMMIFELDNKGWMICPICKKQLNGD